MSNAIDLPTLTCLRCGHIWTPRVPTVVACANPKCRSPYYDRPRKPHKGNP